MKSLKQIEQQIKTFHHTFGVDLLSAQQGSTAWLQSRLGVITASDVHNAVAEVKTEKRKNYLYQLVSEVATGTVEEINAKALDWGNMQEPAARASYEFANDVKIHQLGFVFRNESFREGASLDGLVVAKKKHVEIKCPYNTANYIKFLVEDKIKSEYMWQYQYQMRVTGAEVADFVQYDPRMSVSPFKVLTVERDEEYQKKFDDLIPAFILDMDSLLDKIGLTFGSQWTRLANNESTGAA